MVNEKRLIFEIAFSHFFVFNRIETGLGAEADAIGRLKTRRRCTHLIQNYDRFRQNKLHLLQKINFFNEISRNVC